VNPGSLVFRPPGSASLKKATNLPVEDSGDLAKLAEAEDVLIRFLRAANWKERILLVRNKLNVASAMEAFYSKNSDGPMPFDSIVEGTEVSPKFCEFVVVFEGGGRRFASIENTAEGPRVDWAAFVGIGDMAWSEFLESKRSSPVMFRVLVSPAGHFENQFGDPALLNCYSLRNISEPGAKVVYGYVDKKSALAKELNFSLEQASDATIPMILKLKFPIDAPVDFQVWIHQFFQGGWAIK
jgi:hypothetical protein